MLSSPPRGAARNRTQGGEAAPHREEATHSSKQSPEPLVPSGRGSRDVTKRQGARVPGPLQVSRTPLEPSPDPTPTTKDSLASRPHLPVSVEPPPTSNPNLVSSENSALGPKSPALEGRTPSPAFAPGPGASENLTLLASLLPAGPKVRTSPQGYCTYPPRARQLSARLGPGRAMCGATRVGSSQRGARRSSAAQGGGAADRARDCSPRPGNARKTDTRQK